MGEGDTYDAALAAGTSAIRFHIDTFGPDAFDADEPILNAILTETKVRSNIKGSTLRAIRTEA